MAHRSGHRFQFSGVELTVLAAGFVATCVVIFLLGLWVGREVASQHAPVDERVARIPATEARREAPVARPPEGQTAPATGPAPRAAGPALPSTGVREPGSSGETGAETKRPELPGDAPGRAGEGQPAASRDTAGDVPEGVLATPVTPPPASRKGALVPEEAEALGEATVPPESATGYTVQVLATRNRNEADALIAQLKGHGYGAFISPVEDVGGKWYRVRIGRYDEPQSARAMAERCRRDLGLSQAYVSPF